VIPKTCLRRKLKSRPLYCCRDPVGLFAAGIDTAGIDTAGIETVGIVRPGIDTDGRATVDGLAEATASEFVTTRVAGSQTLGPLQVFQIFLLLSSISLLVASWVVWQLQHEWQMWQVRYTCQVL